eukprot:COSAG04_NODE_340_length_16315_cov_1278.534410_16_plen_85_part_00
MATHSPRASSAPPPRCHRLPASLQLSRSAPKGSTIAFAFCARPSSHYRLYIFQLLAHEVPYITVHTDGSYLAPGAASNFKELEH